MKTVKKITIGISDRNKRNLMEANVSKNKKQSYFLNCTSTYTGQ